MNSNKDLVILRNHLEKYNLLTKKASDYILFKQAVNLMKEKIHLTKEGLQQIVNIKASINNGLSDKLKLEF